MRSTPKCVVLLAVGATLAACASGNKPHTDVTASSNTPPAATHEGGVVLGALADAKLPDGKCGMLIWTLEGQSVAPVFRYVAGGAGTIVINGKAIELARIEAEGATGFGVAAQQKFTSGAGLTVDVTVAFDAPFDGGAWLRNGLISVETEDGWKTVAPAAGVAGCRS